MQPSHPAPSTVKLVIGVLLLATLPGPTSTSISGEDALRRGGGGYAPGHSPRGGARTPPFPRSPHSGGPGGYSPPRHARAPADSRPSVRGGSPDPWSIWRGLLGMATLAGRCFGCSAWRQRPEHVTRDNFAETCDEMEALLPSAAFLSLDLEMTSLKGPAEMEGSEQGRLNWADSTEDRYRSMRQVVLTNTILSVGLCLFHAPGRGAGGRATEGPLVARPYNFLVFPEPMSTPNLTLNMQTLVDFHVEECNFDFNKWIYAGIPYTDAAGETGLYNMMRAQHGLTAFNKMTRSVLERPRVQLTAEGDLRFMRSALEGLDEWLRGQGPQRKALEYQLPACNSFLRLALHQTVAHNYPHLRIMMRPRESVSHGAGGRTGSWLPWLWGRGSVADECGRGSSRGDGRSSWGTSDKVLFVADQTDARWSAQSDARVRELVKKRLGFRRVFAALSESRRPLVLHNGIYIACGHSYAVSNA